MSYALTLSPCARYVAYRPSLITDSRESAQDRTTAAMAFARQHGTHRVLLDWRDHDFPLGNRFSDALYKLRDQLPRGAWRIALLYSLESRSYTVEMINGFADILDALGQSTARFTDIGQAAVWLVEDAPVRVG
jgi:hypothetical protein